MTEAQQEVQKKGKEISERFIKRHPEFRASKEMSQRIGDWFRQQDVPFNYENLERAYRAVESEKFVNYLVDTVGVEAKS